MARADMAAAEKTAGPRGVGTERIPFLDLVTPHRLLEAELLAAFQRALRAGVFIGGAEVEAFEAEFGDSCGAPHCVGVSSGTDALRLALHALDMKRGDEVITVANTFIATTEAISQAGGTIRFVDVDEATLTMDPCALEAAISPRVVGIVPVHLYGQPADLDPILEIARRHGLWVLEDACQAHGARYRDRPVGSLGNLAAFSFYPGKNLGALGDAGAVTTGDADKATRVRRLREHGQVQKYFHDEEGYTARLDAVQAAFLRVKLRHLARWNEGRRRVAQWYDQALADVPEVRCPTQAPYAEHVYHLYVVRVANRDGLRRHLEEAQIGVGMHYPLPLHLQRAYARHGLKAGAFPVTERSAETGLSLPMFPELTEAHVRRVTDAIRSFYR